MSIVCVQYGQCGNQIGQSLYNTINEDILSKHSQSLNTKRTINKWFHVNKRGHWEPRAVLVDTEVKSLENSYSLPFKFKNVAAKSLGGSANNWAFGYMCNSKLLKSEILDAVRCEFEKCDFVTSILNIFSSSGGTGSGIGSYIIECIRKEYPSKNITNAIVLPYSQGEIVTQSINTVLSLSHLYSLANNTILFQNEKIQYVCNYSMNIKNVTVKDINNLIAKQLACVYQPIINVSGPEILNELTLHPNYKYLQIRTEPNTDLDNKKFESLQNWKPLISALAKQSRFEFTQQQQYKTLMKTKNLSGVLITRGCEKYSDSDLIPLKDKNLYVPWLTLQDAFKVYHDSSSFLNSDKALANVINSNSIFVPLNSIVEDAWNLFVNNAYVHHYKKYGIDEEYFLNSFQTMEDILHDYKNL